MSTASVNLFGCGNSPTIPLFRIAPKSLRSPFTAISGDKKPNFAKGVQLRWPIKASSTNDLRGVYATRQLELTVKNVDLVLEDVRPYLIADSGNVDVVSVEDGIICLELQGACGSCPSSITTMKMVIERALKEKFGDAVKDVQQVKGGKLNETTVEAVNRHLDILRPAIKNYGGEVDVISIVGRDCTVRYEGPQSIGSGIEAAIKERFPDVVNVVFNHPGQPLVSTIFNGDNFDNWRSRLANRGRGSYGSATNRRAYNAEQTALPESQYPTLPGLNGEQSKQLF